MSAIAGVVAWASTVHAGDPCASILPLLAAFGSRTKSREGLSASFGAVLDDVLPEDRFDEQPLTGGGGRYFMAADIRIDNRDELASTLKFDRSEEAQISDSALLLRAWERWQLDCFHHLLGDAAVAVWDSQSRRLTLARTASSLRPLFYYRGAGFAAFASSPQALLALPGLSRRPGLSEAAAIVAGLPGRRNATIFSGISMVRHAHAVEITSDSEHERRHWHPENISRQPIALGEAATALRSELDRAVQAQLRRLSGGVTSQLSSGRDSTAVTASAALLLASRGEPLLAITGSPNERFAGPFSAGRLADESELASLVAARYDNVEHVVCRSGHRDIAAEFRRLATHYFRPLPNPTALHWAAAVEEEARRRGTRIMLIGSTGNFSISASGPKHLVDVLRRSGPVAWARIARHLGASSPDRWRNIASTTLGPFLPAALYRGLLIAAGRSPGQPSLPVLRQPYRAEAEEMLRAEFGDVRPSRDYRRFRCEMLLIRDNSDKSSIALSGIDVRDPTADRRLVELCLSFPPEHLVSRQSSPSPVYLEAFRDRIPPEVMQNPRRGVQGADWFLLFTKADIERCFDMYRRSPVVAELFDFDEIDRLVGDWPADGAAEWEVVSLFRYQLLQALAVAAFLAEQFPETSSPD